LDNILGNNSGSRVRGKQIGGGGGIKVETSASGKVKSTSSRMGQSWEKGGGGQREVKGGLRSSSTAGRQSFCPL